MTEPTKAEIMLDSVTKSNRLINYLRFCKEHPIPPLRLDLRPSTKVSIKAYQDGVQNYIDRLTAQNEKVVSLVKQIPDGEVQLVLQLRFGYDPGFLLLVEYAILESKGGEPVWVKGMCIDAQNAAMKKNFFPVWASCPLWKPIWSGKVF